MRKPPNADDVRAYREKHECGIFEAKIALRMEWRCAVIADIRRMVSETRSMETCRDALLELLELLAED